MTQCLGREWDAIPNQAFLPTARLLGTEKPTLLNVLRAPSRMPQGLQDTRDPSQWEALQTPPCKPTLQEQSQGTGTYPSLGS